MADLLARFARNGTGAAAIEYCLVAAATGLAVFGAVKLVGPSVKDIFNNIAPNISSVSGEPTVHRSFEK